MLTKLNSSSLPSTLSRIL